MAADGTFRGNESVTRKPFLTKEKYCVFFSVIIPGLPQSKDAIQLGCLSHLLPRRYNRILFIAAPLPLAAPAGGHRIVLLMCNYENTR